MKLENLFCTKFIGAALGVVAGFGVTNLHAESITQTRSQSAGFATYAPSVNAGLASGQVNEFLGFAQFDPTLGTLNSISLTVHLDYYDLKNRSSFPSFRAPYSYSFAIGNQGYADIFSTSYSDSVNLPEMTGLGVNDWVFSGNPAYQLLAQHSLTNTSAITDFSGFIGNGLTGLFVHEAASGYGIDFYFAGYNGFPNSFQGNSPFPLTHVFNVDADLTYEYSAPVPEPETYAMMLAGLGLLGFAARRRRIPVAQC